MIDRELQAYFNFDEADLFANRSGVLTEKQKNRLNSNAQSTKNMFLIGGWVIVAIAILPGIILYLVGVPALFFIIWTVVWVPIWIFIGIRVMRMGRPDARDFLLKSVEGEINIVKQDEYNYTTEQREVTYELHVGGVAFDVDSDLADIMMQGDTYAIYYMDGTKEIVSAEKI